MNRIHRLTSTVLSLSLLFVLGACDSGGANDDDPAEASFTMTVSGDAEESIDGFAFFGEAEDPETGEEVFVIYFSETENVSTQAGTWAFIGRNSDRPGTGTYSFVDADQDGEIPDNQFVLVAALGESPTEAITYVSNAGELTITDSGSDRMEGSFDVAATGFQFTGTEAQEVEVSIEGSFNASNRDDVFVPFDS